MDETLQTSGSSSTATMSPSMARFMATRSGMRMSCPTLSDATQPSAELNLLTRSAPCKTTSRHTLGTQSWQKKQDELVLGAGCRGGLCSDRSMSVGCRGDNQKATA